MMCNKPMGFYIDFGQVCMYTCVKTFLQRTLIMTIHEARKEQLASMKNRSLKEKLPFFWEYYGIRTIALVVAAVTVIAFVVNLATKKEPAFTGVFFGANPQPSADSYLEDFGQSAAIDVEKYDLTVQCQPDIRMEQQITPDIYSYMESFTAMVAAQSVDCFAANSELYLYFGYLEYAVDLRTVLTTEEIEALKPYLYYIDAHLIEQQESANEGYASAYSQRPDATKPELMKDPVPVGVSLSIATDAFKESYVFGSDAVIGICASAPYRENALAFLRHCLNHI